MVLRCLSCASGLDSAASKYQILDEQIEATAAAGFLESVSGPKQVIVRRTYRTARSNIPLFSEPSSVLFVDFLPFLVCTALFLSP